MKVGRNGIERWKVDLARDWREECAEACAEDDHFLLVMGEDRIWFVIHLKLWIAITSLVFHLLLGLLILVRGVFGHVNSKVILLVIRVRVVA